MTGSGTVNRSGEFHQIFSSDACGDKDQLNGFSDEEIKGQGHSCGQKYIFGSFCHCRASSDDGFN